MQSAWWVCDKWHQSTKLESYLRPGVSERVQFYMDVEGHIDEPAMVHAMEELQFYCMKAKSDRLVPMPPAQIAISKANAPVANHPVFRKLIKCLSLGWFVSYKTKEVWVDIFPANPVRSEGSSRSRMFMGCSVFRFILPSGQHQWLANNCLLW